MTSSSEPIEAAKADLQRIRERRMAIRDTKAKLDAEDAGLGMQEGELETTLKVMARYGLVMPAKAASTSAPSAPKKASPGPASQVEAVMRAVVGILAERGDTHSDELYDLVLRTGVQVNGNRPRDYFATILSRNKGAYNIDTSRKRGWFVANGSNGHDALASGGKLGLVDKRSAA